MAGTCKWRCARAASCIADSTRHSEDGTILMDVQPMFYPIGNTKAVSVYHNPFGEEEFRALFLGCGDPRHAIATAAEAGKDPKLKLLQLSLNDWTPAIVARAGLLLLMASEVDPECREDVALLWAVWHCLDFSSHQAMQLHLYLRRLLAGQAGQKRVLPSADEARKRRIQWIGECPSAGSTEIVDFGRKVEGCMGYEALRIKPFMSPMHSYERNRIELRSWFETGSAHPMETAKEGMMANPTLLQPGTWAWQVHYGSCLFSSFYPLECEPHESGSSQQLQTLLHNSLRAKPSRQQERVLGVPKFEWKASFLLPAYLQRHEPTAQHESTESDSNSRAPARTASPREASNGVTQGTRTEADRSLDGARPDRTFELGLCQAATVTVTGGADMKDPAIVDLKKALYLNSAAALLKQAEAAHGAPSLKPPEELSRSQKADLGPAVFYCQRALEAEPGNAKALYRQAQAYMYLGDNKRAGKALRRANRSTEPDTAVDRLEKLLQERLQLSG